MIDTERLTLRPHGLSDLEGMAAMWADPAVVQHITGKPQTAEESWARLQRYAGHWALKGFGFWAVLEKESGDYLGELGFMDFKRAMSLSFGETPEMGWAFAAAAHGKGYAEEAARGALGWADAHFGRARIVCMISPTNEPSKRLAAKLGFREFARTQYKGDVVLYERAAA